VSVKFRVLHCLRAPVGGLFRHVRDLATVQAALGHHVGVVADAANPDPLTEGRFAELEPHLALGLLRVPMSREIGYRDVTALRAVKAFACRIDANIIHGHGAKGGAYARLAAKGLKANRRAIACFYTPHGGSLHYAPTSPKGRIYMGLERHLARSTDGLIFESAYARDKFDAGVGSLHIPRRVIPNGVLDAELQRRTLNSDAAEFLFIGELRMLKGVDVLLRALKRVAAARPARLVIVGAGPDEKRFRALSAELELTNLVTFAGALPAAEAFKMGQVLVMPSRAESLPYVVLEAAAAAVPLVATAVGGIPEVTSGTGTSLVPPDNDEALADAMLAALADPAAAVARTETLRSRVSTAFTVTAMTHAINLFYSDRLAAAAARNR
jgi:glycosyltransferase involved in cell wall biosynthesis